MTAAASADATLTVPSLTKRAMELSHDSEVSLSQGAQHLVHLARGSAVPLELALADLDREHTPSFEREYARLLLRIAITELATPSLSAGAHRRVSDPAG